MMAPCIFAIPVLMSLGTSREWLFFVELIANLCILVGSTIWIYRVASQLDRQNVKNIHIPFFMALSVSSMSMLGVILSFQMVNHLPSHFRWVP
jgi:hypothetical protein